MNERRSETMRRHWASLTPEERRRRALRGRESRADVRAKRLPRIPSVEEVCAYIETHLPEWP